MGGRADVQAKWEGPLSCVLSCLALVSCRVRVFPVFGTPDLGDRYCVRTGWACHGQAHGQGRAGQGSLAGPEGLSPKIATPGMGEKRAGWLLKPNNKALAQAQTQAQKPEPSSGLFGDGIGTRGDERRESVPRSQGSIWSQ